MNYDGLMTIIKENNINYFSFSSVPFNDKDYFISLYHERNNIYVFNKENWENRYFYEIINGNDLIKLLKNNDIDVNIGMSLLSCVFHKIKNVE